MPRGCTAALGLGRSSQLGGDRESVRHIHRQEEEYLVAFGRCRLMVPLGEDGGQFFLSFILRELYLVVVGHPVFKEILE